MNDKHSVSIYDTTLRDGTQGEGISFSPTSKLRVAEKLDQFGIDYIEGGWPGSNPRDMAFFEQARDLDLKHAKIAAFGSTRRMGKAVEDDGQLKLLLEANTPVVTIFGKSWLLHVTEVLKTTPEENLAMIRDSVAYLKEQGKEVCYDAEHFFDGYTDDSDYALACLEAAASGGADWLTLCDTNGGKMIGELQGIVTKVVGLYPNKKVGIHCHNDCGLGVALSLAGVEVGARMVQGTMNGYGERIGNANLTSIMPALALKMGYPINAGENMGKLRDLSLFVDEMANLRPNIKEPFVGASAFAHKGGVHANAAEKVAHSYEHIRPEAVGNKQRVLVSDMSGRTSIMMKARELGLNVEEKSPEMAQFLQDLKDLEFKGYEFEAADASFKLLLAKFGDEHKSFFKPLGYRVIVERDERTGETSSEATVKVKVGDEVHHDVAEASGPIGALDHALRKALAKAYPGLDSLKLKDFKVRIMDSSQGADATIRVQIESGDGKGTWGTVGASDNIIEASWEALRDSVEYKLLQDES